MLDGNGFAVTTASLEHQLPGARRLTPKVKDVLQNGRLVRIHIPALLVASSLTFPATARSHSTVARSAIVDFSRVGIDNFGRVNSNYYRGAQPKGHDYSDLAALGVKTLIDLTGDDGQADEKRMVETAGMTYVHIPMTTHAPPAPETLAQFLTIVTDPARLPVYVHCVGGRHRTGVMTAAYRISQEGWTPDRAFAEMKQYKFGADFLHREFKKFVYGYHPEPGRQAAGPALAAPKTGG
jgi:tyrosine-protein phosphatase SIW14